ncbi:hypothetical protein MACH08_09140 [Oceanobacillus kimchii]|uniref:Uncharacterized protein n=1 Tax=Oceanobacillus kimchii TaxID=746691 RepID=A0ABQ5TGH9_9BACI|nr:hypothetical protein MACH08_09140 [Oceanobacillus kimchii]
MVKTRAKKVEDNQLEKYFCWTKCKRFNLVRIIAITWLCLKWKTVTPTGTARAEDPL